MYFHCSNGFQNNISGILPLSSFLIFVSHHVTI